MTQTINCFQKDINRTDTELPFHAWQVTLTAIFLLSLAIPVMVYVPISTALLFPWCLTIFMLVEIYRWSPLKIESLVAPFRTDYFKYLEEAIDGRTTLVICGRQEEFQQRLNKIIDNMNSVHFMSFAADAWVSHAVAVTNGLFTWLVGVLVVHQRESLAPALGMLMFILAPDISNVSQILLQAMCLFQGGMNSVKRLDKQRVSSEDEGVLSIEGAVSKSWPPHGGIKIHDFYMRYREETPLVLHGLTLNVLPAEKIGIVGRTGAGKSSLLNILLRIVNIEAGTIMIDGIDIAQLGVHDLRSKMAVIPQDPISFGEKIWLDLDPLENPDDQKTRMRLEDALRAVCLIQEDDDSEEKDSHIKKQSLSIDDDASNLSAGSQQLVSLARALLQDSKIILIDEATSNVDMQTDAQIQQTVRTQFKDCTVLTIAHRIRTVITYDKICVMDAGRVVQFGTPSELWKDQGGIFRRLCDVQGISPF